MIKQAERRRTGEALLQGDILEMLRERCGNGHDAELAHDLIVVIRERVLQEIGTYARRNIR